MAAAVLDWLRGSRISRGRELSLLLGIYLIYALSHVPVRHDTFQAFYNAYRILEWERRLGLLWELSGQALAFEYRWLIRVANFVYLYGHLPLLLALTFWLLWRRPRLYAFLRNAFLISFGIGILIYQLFPAAPPRFFPQWGFVDTLALFSRINYNQPWIQRLYNPYAAMPSLHQAWATLSGLALAGMLPPRRRRLRILVACLPPLAMGIAVVVSGNHFILDVLAGQALILFSLGIARGLERWLGRPEPTSDPQPS